MSASPFEQPSSSRWTGFAYASLALALMSVIFAPLLVFSVAAMVVGWVARAGIRKSPEKERGTTIAFVGMLLGFVSLVMGVGYHFSVSTSDQGVPKMKAFTTMVSMEQGVNAFYTEYGQLRDVGSRVKTDSPEGVKLLTILLGLEDPSGVIQNKRKIRFLSVKDGHYHKNGLIFSADKHKVEGLYDPWGNPYTVLLDTKNEGKLHFEIAGRPVDLDARRVAATSPGPDKRLGTGDDVRNW